MSSVEEIESIVLSSFISIPPQNDRCSLDANDAVAQSSNQAKTGSFAAAQKASYEEVAFHAMHGLAIKNDYLDLLREINGLIFKINENDFPGVDDNDQAEQREKIIKQLFALCDDFISKYPNYPGGYAIKGYLGIGMSIWWVDVVEPSIENLQSAIENLKLCLGLDPHYSDECFKPGEIQEIYDLSLLLLEFALEQEKIQKILEGLCGLLLGFEANDTVAQSSDQAKIGFFAESQKASYEEVSFHAMHGVAIKNDFLDLRKEIDGLMLKINENDFPGVDDDRAEQREKIVKQLFALCDDFISKYPNYPGGYATTLSIGISMWFGGVVEPPIENLQSALENLKLCLGLDPHYSDEFFKPGEIQRTYDLSLLLLELALEQKKIQKIEKGISEHNIELLFGRERFDGVGLFGEADIY
jgi:hypothetical protein